MTQTENPGAEQSSRPALQPNASAALQQHLDAPSDRWNTEDTSDRGDLGGKCFTGEVETAFAAGKDIDQMKAMVANANPELVLGVADAWKNIHDHLVTGGGSVKGDFDKTVEQVLKHWEGDSADEFAKKAKKISKQITDCATYARYTSIAMGDAGDRLSDIKPKVDAIEKPSDTGKALDKIGDGFTRSDDNWKQELEGKGGAQKALDGHDSDLSAGKEEQLKAAALMETLAITYTTQSRTMGSWSRRRPSRDGGDGDYPGEPGGVVPAPVPIARDGSSPGAAVPSTGRGGGATSSGTTARSTSPNGAVRGSPAPGTKVDGISGGTATGTGRGGANPGAPAGGGLGSGTGVGSGGGGGGAGGPGFVGQASGNRAGAGGGAARGAAGGRAPAGLGSGAGGGAGGKGATGAAGRGPLARSRGGKLDTPEQGQGAARQGGQGLHSSRGGTAAGDRGRNTNGVMRGGVGGNNSRRRVEENSQGPRPDYLVEDEETWMPKRRDITPPTIN